MKHLVGDELAIPETPAVIGDDRAALRSQPFGQEMQLRRRLLDQDRPHLSGGIHDRGAAVLHRMAAGCVAFVRGPRRVGGDQVNRRRFDDEFLRGELNQRRLQPWPSSALPVKTVIVPSASMRIQESSIGSLLRLPGSGGSGIG